MYEFYYVAIDIQNDVRHSSYCRIDAGVICLIEIKSISLLTNKRKVYRRKSRPHNGYPKGYLNIPMQCSKVTGIGQVEWKRRKIYLFATFQIAMN